MTKKAYIEAPAIVAVSVKVQPLLDLSVTVDGNSSGLTTEEEEGDASTGLARSGFTIWDDEEE